MQEKRVEDNLQACAATNTTSMSDNAWARN